jgi:hypothetical protein
MLQSFRQIGMYLALCGLSACTAWQYDIEACDVHARDLSKDVCNQLNDGSSSSCLIYQCDGQTASCKQSVRDYDRDGDPDVACGGTDCNDFDPSVYGSQGSQCTCTQDSIGTPCTVGPSGSTCQRSSMFSCIDKTLICNATPGAPQSEYQAGPDATNKSWDWNCDGQVEQACSWMDPSGRSYRTIDQCPPSTCSDQLKMDLANNMPLTLCSDYCSTISDKATCTAPQNVPKLLNCDAQPFCGSHVGVCFCKWIDVSVTPPYHGCTNESYSTIGSIYCR